MQDERQRWSWLYLVPHTWGARRKIYERSTRPAQHSPTFCHVRSAMKLRVARISFLRFFPALTSSLSSKGIGSNLYSGFRATLKILRIQKLFWSDRTSLHITMHSSFFILPIPYISFLPKFDALFLRLTVLFFAGYKFTTFISNHNKRFRRTSTRPLFVLNRARFI